MTEIVSAIQPIVKVYPSEAPEDAAIPYAVYTTSRTPIRTKSGIAGYEGMLQLSVVARTKREVRQLSERIVEAIDNRDFGGDTLILSESADSENAEYGLSITDLTFNIL